MRAILCSRLALAAVLSLPAAAQQRDTAASGFEVVSIRPNTSSTAERGLELQPSGRIVWTAVTLKQLIETAYQRWAFDNREVIGGPEWLDASGSTSSRRHQVRCASIATASPAPPSR